MPGGTILYTSRCLCTDIIDFDGCYHSLLDSYPSASRLHPSELRNPAEPGGTGAPFEIYLTRDAYEVQTQAVDAQLHILFIYLRLPSYFNSIRGGFEWSIVLFLS